MTIQYLAFLSVDLYDFLTFIFTPFAFLTLRHLLGPTVYWSYMKKALHLTEIIPAIVVTLYLRIKLDIEREGFNLIFEKKLKPLRICNHYEST